MVAIAVYEPSCASDHDVQKKKRNRKKESPVKTANGNEPRPPVSAGSGRSRSEKGDRNANQRTPPTMKLVLGTLRDGNSKRLDVVTDLFLADIVHRVMEKEDRQRDGTTGSTG